MSNSKKKLTVSLELSEKQASLGLFDAVSIIVGIVIGAGIFETPALVAANAGNGIKLIGLWLVGGIISLIGALCFAELATTYPHPGGSYYYLHRAFGKRIAFLFAWARLSVVQTGSIALLAFVFGDYTAQIFSLDGLGNIGNYSASIYAGLAIIISTGLNIIGIRQGKRAQNWLSVLKILGLILVVIAGLIFAFTFAPAQPPPTSSNASNNLGLGLVFVLLSYGGWNEAAFISAELKNAKRNILRSLILSIGIITAIYILINFAYLQGLGINGMANSKAVAADLMRQANGESGAIFISLLISISTLGALNASVLTGARSNYALGKDFSLFSFLGKWNNATNTPTNAYLLQGIIALALIVLGSITRKGFETMVDFTAPVFWFFFLLCGLSLFILRNREFHVERAFQVPLYPLTPIIFCLTCGYLIYSSTVYTGIGSLVGVVVVLIGIPLAVSSEQ
ncbi:amino acid transporter [Rivularia sp. PCC 7116]|uniref:APC family permease n=1 Tax=Rivularia sp. PCC 7116 TaxID=373994 RepID=UPI00029F11CA|nr:amino acid permease [Rivularia sp. PCC 7116]AFY56893.1 amino acid transporter [Rivularia sp. PCC 7116]